MSHLLYISHSDLYSRDGGGLASLCYLNALKVLFDKNIDIIVPEESIGKIKDRSYFHLGIPKRKKINGFLSICLGRLHRFYPACKKFVDANCDKYDLCVINGGMYAGDMIDYIKSKGIKVVVIHHNYEPEYHRDNKTAPSFYGLSTYFIKRNELNAYRKADLNLFITHSDLWKFQDVYGKSVAPCGVIGVFEVSEMALPELKNQSSIAKCISITGSLNTVQTEIGIKDFFINYFEILQSQFSDWRVLIAGRAPSPYIQQLEQKYTKVEVVANPESIEDIINSSNIFLCPTNVGGGLKLRVMDGLRNGLPVICHTKSARGYDFLKGKPFFRTYNDKTTFEKVLKDTVAEIDTYNYSKQNIQNEYLKYFGFNAGVERIKQYISFLTDL